MTALLATGVDVVAGARVTDRERALAGVRAGECGTGLHDRGVEKVYVAAADLTGSRHAERQP